MDAVLHEERLEGRAGQPRTFAARPRRQHSRRFENLPDGAFVVIEGAAWLVHGDRILRYNPGGYDLVSGRPDGPATVLTPPSIIRILASDYVPCLHDSAAELAVHR